MKLMIINESYQKILTVLHFIVHNMIALIFVQEEFSSVVTTCIIIAIVVNILKFLYYLNMLYLCSVSSSEFIFYLIK